MKNHEYQTKQAKQKLILTPNDISKKKYSRSLIQMIIPRSFCQIILIVFFIIFQVDIANSQMTAGFSESISHDLTDFDSTGCCLIDTMFIPAPTWPAGVAREGDYFWYGAHNENSIFKMDLEGNVVSEIPLSSNSYEISGGGIHFDGEYLWVVNEDNSILYQILAATETIVGTFELPSGDDGWGITGNDDFLWHSEYGIGDQSRIYKMKKTSLEVVDSFFVNIGDILGIQYIGDDLLLATRPFPEPLLCIVDANTGEVLSTEVICFGYPLGLTIYNDSIFIMSSLISPGGDQVLYSYDNSGSLEVEVVVDPSTCAGACDGSVNILASGGVPPYSNIGLQSDLCPGTYTQIVTDSFECKQIVTYTIPESIGLQLEIITYPTCMDECTGGVEINAIGATDVVNYTIMPAVTDLSSICSGQYNLTVGDANNCIIDTFFVIEELEGISITVDTIISDTNEMGIGAIFVTINGATDPYKYEWILDGNPISTTEDLEGIDAGNYQLNVTDINGCVVSTEITVLNTIVSSTSEVLDSEYLPIFPNPSSSVVNFSLKNAKEIKVDIYNLTGELLVDQLTLYAENGIYQVDINSLPNGLYAMKIKAGKAYFTSRFVVQH